MPLASESASGARPPIYRHRDALLIPTVLAAIGLYFSHGGRLPVPGAFGKVDVGSGQATFNQWIWTAAIAVSFYFVFGLAGRFAFSTAAIVGVGAYVSAYTTRSGNNPVVGVVAAAVVCGVLGYVFAVLMRRANHFYFAVATLGLSEILLIILTRWDRLSGSTTGEISGTADIDVFGFVFDSRPRQFWLLLGFLGSVLVVGYLIERSPLRRDAIAARDDPVLAESLGVRSHRVGIAMFTLGAVIAGIAGALYVHTRGFASPETFGINLGLGVFVVLILGGMHSLWGALVGAWFYIYVPLYLGRWEEWSQVVWGLVLLVVMIALPTGLVGVWQRLIGHRLGSTNPVAGRIRHLVGALPGRAESGAP